MAGLEAELALDETADKVGSMVVFEDGLPKRSDYRRFEIRDVRGQDDFAIIPYTVFRKQFGNERTQRGPFGGMPAMIAVLPKEVKMEVNKCDGISSDELQRRLAGHLAELARAGIVFGGNDDAGSAAEPAGAVSALSEAEGVS